MRGLGLPLASLKLSLLVDSTIWENPWFWTGVGAGVVVAVVVATVVALIVVSEPAQGIEGTLEPSIVELGR